MGNFFVGTSVTYLFAWLACSSAVCSVFSSYFCVLLESDKLQ